jgi:16S rRNA (guanine527-N7)-methyltransferase
MASLAAPRLFRGKRLESPILSTGAGSLSETLARNQIELPADQIALIERFCLALWDWNSRINLTRHTDYDKIVQRDIVDALALEKLLEPGERILDVGTGGGLPGVLLAILRPDIHVELCDSVGKKAKAVLEIVQQVGLPIPVHALAAQKLLAGARFDTLIARAVAPMAKMLTWFQPHWDEFQRLLLVKGPAWIEERREARERNLMKGLQLRKLDGYLLHGTDSESVILEIRPVESS